MGYNPYSLDGKVLLITGAAGGIGRTTAIECSRLGASLILTDINEEGLKETLSSLEVVSGQEHRYYKIDLTEEQEIADLVENVPALDGCVCNAGVMKLTLTQFITIAEIERVQRINLIAPMLLTKYLVKRKRVKRGTSIVFTASAGGVFRVSVGNGIYATTKCGIDAFMRTVALELGPKGVRCNSVNPGMVETNLVRNGQFTEEDHRKELQNYPLGRYGQPLDVALAVIYLLSDASSWVTGTALKIDGGMTLS
ncbi:MULTISPECIES: SDR family NAD(P)-dependent oxidoreductase [Butyricimonas]|uniref:SDR family oxidoreductase n=1 Tax=Butyricimonas hominis TaxID=2763032 RepID=A0ABR7D484_9BACT|nr:MULTISPECIES: SDR family oxidoreductase [Butyricimonas]MBC5622745.1 SDR family oxidoreductase [Butyricimonas hominis]